MTDNFRGDNANLIASINALLELDAEGALVPHGIGGHARALLSAAASRLSASIADTAGAKQDDVRDALDIAEQLDEMSDRITRFSNYEGDAVCARAAQLLRTFANHQAARRKVMSDGDLQDIVMGLFGRYTIPADYKLANSVAEFVMSKLPRSAPYGAPFTTDVAHCCGDPETCNDPCEPAIDTAGAKLEGGEWRAIFNSARSPDATFEQFCGWMREEIAATPAPSVAAPTAKSMRCPRGGGSCAVESCVEEGACTMKRVTESASSVADAAGASERDSRIATVTKDLIECLMLWNGQASAGLDVNALAGLRDELNAIAKESGND